jgi:hypothetical protein
MSSALDAEDFSLALYLREELGDESDATAGQSYAVDATQDGGVLGCGVDAMQALLASLTSQAHGLEREYRELNTTNAEVLAEARDATRDNLSRADELLVAHSEVDLRLPTQIIPVRHHDPS